MTEPFGAAVRGAQLIVEAMSGFGITHVFANPGSTEAALVAAVGARGDMEQVLCLSEGVAAGAADGFFRSTGRPAATLLHLGPGLANAFSNLHNARRAASGVLNLVGDHLSWHKQADPPLETDIHALARAASSYAGQFALDSEGIAALVEACAVAVAGGVATLVAPHDATLGLVPAGLRSACAALVRSAAEAGDRPQTPERDVQYAADAIRAGRGVGFLLGGSTLRSPAVEHAARILETGARAFAETSPACWTRGRGLADLPQLAFDPDTAREQLADLELLVLCGARAPVAFFGSREGLPSSLMPAGCETVQLGTDLQSICSLLPIPARPSTGVADSRIPESSASAGPGCSPDQFALTFAQALPDSSIVIDEGITAGRGFAAASVNARAHDFMTLTGGALGQGIALAVGVAIGVAAGGGRRPVYCLVGDGSAMYSFPGLWTQSELGLDITTLVLNNRGYATLESAMQVERASRQEPAAAADAFAVNGIQWTDLARGLGVPSVSVDGPEELDEALAKAGPNGPRLIEVQMRR
jgi:acetolactate synthase I/II/III large subunit